MTGNLTYLPSFSSQANSSLAVSVYVSQLFFSRVLLFLSTAVKLWTLLSCRIVVVFFVLVYPVEV